MLGWLTGSKCESGLAMRHGVVLHCLTAVIGAIPARYKNSDDEPIVDIVARVVADAEAERVDHDKTRCALAVANGDIRAIKARLAEAEHRIEVQVRALDTAAARFDAMKADRDAAVEASNLQAGLNGDLARAVEAANARVRELETLVGNARNQLDGRKHHPDEPVFLPTYTPEVLM